ncbi:unnamed protein product [Cyprideis torosa]|uniref:Uncharacterized protein n=1 Tax=Cyprideis torosa TaxID=163714 RepID=A0A7R8ZZ53_9CRUS|nr:unnamed protein product [Cyprideis torosa]CAG0912106.1 unnamed protein product [Cyprideis torosa]
MTSSPSKRSTSLLRTLRRPCERSGRR